MLSSSSANSTAPPFDTVEHLENLLWPLERQARQLQDTLADAMAVWRDTNARTADTRFLTPRATAETETLVAIKSQHQELERTAAEIDQATTQLAAEESDRVRRLGEDVRHAAAAARERTSSSAAITSSADHSTVRARAAINRANAAAR